MLILVHKAVCLCSRKLEHPEGWVALPDGPKVGDSSNSNQNIIFQLVDDWGILPMIYRGITIIFQKKHGILMDSGSA
jgi:hypothetical protein